MMFLSIVSGSSLRDIAKTSNDIILRRIDVHTLVVEQHHLDAITYNIASYYREAREYTNPFGDIWRSHLGRRTN